MLPKVLSLAHMAGQKIMAIYEASAAEQLIKIDGSPLTAADLAAHHIIVNGLQSISPELPVLSEESALASYAKRLHWKKFWLIDPLDGTKEFLKRNGEFTVNIALIENGNPVLGVVHAPALGLSYFAAKGGGAFRQIGNDVPSSIKVAAHQPNEPLKLVGSRSHRDARQDELAAYLGVGKFQNMGSSLKFCLVAEGRAHLYPRLGPTMEWDTAAAHSIVLEAGGVVCDDKGVALRYNKPDLHNPPFMVLAAADLELRDKLKSWKW